MQGKKKLAEFGELHPSIAKQLKIKTNVVVAIVDDIDVLPKPVAKRKVVKFGDFQPITRDFAFIVPNDFMAEKLTGVARSVSPLISDVVVFDSFEMADGNRSIAFTITITPTEKMTDADLTKLHGDVIAAVEKKFPAKIRDK